MEQSADWMEQEIARLLADRSSGGENSPFRDFVPEKEEHLHASQGMGVGLDFVPEGYTAPEWVERQRKQERLKMLEDAENEAADIEAIELAAKNRAEERPPAKRLGRPPKGNGAAQKAA